MEENNSSNKELETNNTIEGIKTKKDGTEYVSNPYLFKEIMKSKEQDKLTDAAIQMIMLMVDNIITKKTFKSSEDKEDCKQSALLDCLQYWRGFDPEKSNNPFAYFTSIIANGYAKGWNALHPEIKKAPGAIFTSIDNGIYSI